ncbi:hypothetical protein [Rhodovibrio sodomensis]|uniref:hypothetical protein n=1 Tax=Rhodovibrio sodomensis TaxID=1088 RepID=UPI0019066A40|nr:hypothetical protein [Rhodovibrio sodomensis]
MFAREEAWWDCIAVAPDGTPILEAAALLPPGREVDDFELAVTVHAVDPDGASRLWSFDCRQASCCEHALKLETWGANDDAVIAVFAPPAWRSFRDSNRETIGWSRAPAAGGVAGAEASAIQKAARAFGMDRNSWLPRRFVGALAACCELQSELSHPVPEEVLGHRLRFAIWIREAPGSERAKLYRLLDESEELAFCALGLVGYGRADKIPERERALAHRLAQARVRYMVGRWYVGLVNDSWRMREVSGHQISQEACAWALIERGAHHYCEGMPARVLDVLWANARVAAKRFARAQTVPEPRRPQTQQDLLCDARALALIYLDALGPLPASEVRGEVKRHLSLLGPAGAGDQRSLNRAEVMMTEIVRGWESTPTRSFRAEPALMAGDPDHDLVSHWVDFLEDAYGAVMAAAEAFGPIRRAVASSAGAQMRASG